jgi:hypothetical protein
MGDPLVDDEDGDDLDERPPTFRLVASRAASAPPPPAPAPPPAQKRIRLSTPAEIAQQMRKVFRAVAAGEITAMEGKRQSAILKDLAELHTASHLQTRLDQIEALLTRQGRGR